MNQLVQGQIMVNPPSPSSYQMMNHFISHIGNSSLLSILQDFVRPDRTFLFEHAFTLRRKRVLNPIIAYVFRDGVDKGGAGGEGGDVVKGKIVVVRDKRFGASEVICVDIQSLIFEHVPDDSGELCLSFSSLLPPLFFWTSPLMEF